MIPVYHAVPKSVRLDCNKHSATHSKPFRFLWTKNIEREYFLGGPEIGTFKKLSYEKKLSFYFSLLTSLILKIFLDQSFK